ncbi:MAG TPA: hypothetical protein VGJ22_03715, partial [Anaerolineales bacterium]
MDILRVGGLGTGRVFHDAHVPVYANRADVQLTGVYDPDLPAARRSREHYLKLRREAFPDEQHPEVIIYNLAED